MNIFQTVFRDKTAFVAYITAGQRGLDYTKSAACALVEGGVDLLEIGVPFSDPIADGVVIQAAMEDALKREVNLLDVLATIHEIKSVIDVPIVLFTYCNPLLNFLKADIFSKIKKSGVDGMLMVDMPQEESKEYFNHCAKNKISPINIISPSTPANRIQMVSDHSDAFLYYVCRKGTTGVKDALPEDFEDKLKQIKQATSLPVVAGFGISNKASAKRVVSCADGFVVGSYFVDAISKGATPDELKTLASALDPR